MLAAAPRAAALRRAVALLGTAGLALLARPGLSEPPPTATASAAASVTASVAAQPAGQTAALDASKVQDAVRDMGEAAKKWGGASSALLIDISSGKVLASSAEHAPLNPASNAKLATAAAALRLLGPDHRFLTGLYGKLSGDRVPTLVLRGFGDPTLTSDDLLALARDLHARGARKVGRILVDQSYFDAVFTPPAFAQQPNEWAPFRAPVSAVSINGNTLQITVTPTEDGKPATVLIDPPGAAKVTGTVRTSKKKDPEKVGASTTADAGAVTVKLSGHLPEGGDPVRAWRRLEDPRLAPGLALKAALGALGIEVSGDVQEGGEKERQLLAAHRSEPLSHVLGKLGKDSDNFVAETVFKALAAEKKARPATFDAAAELVAAELRAMGAFEPGCAVKNGSGLFDANRTTAASTAALLRSAYLDPAIGPEYLAQLAVGGADGTLKSRFKPWARSRAIRAKTGTLHAAFALSGYILPPPGKLPLAFALLVNDAPGKASAARASMDKVVDAAARMLWGSPP